MSTLKTRRRYSMCGGDFSSQEVRMFTANTEDPGLIQVFKDGKDLYSEMASRVYNLPYNLCKEFKNILSNIEPHTEVIELSEKFKLLATDKLLVNGKQMQASEIKSGDIIKTSESDITVSSISTEDEIVYTVNIK